LPLTSSRSRPFIQSKETPGSSKSLQKALRILVHMGQHGPELGITQMAAALDLNKTTVYRLLSAMGKFDLIEKNPQSDRYRLGLKLHELGAKALESRTLRGEARRFLNELGSRSKESVSLAVPTLDGVMCVDRFDPANTIITVRTPIGARFSAHATAIGKVVLAYLPDRDVDAILRVNGLPRFTAATRTKLSALKHDLRAVRDRGYSLDEQELERGLSGVAVPVLYRETKLVAAVGIAGPTLRFEGKELVQKIALAKEIAEKITLHLGDRALGFAAL
jgi:DNA-binding IclR family transcriptional regulator